MKNIIEIKLEKYLDKIGSKLGGLLFEPVDDKTAWSIHLEFVRSAMLYKGMIVVIPFSIKVLPMLEKGIFTIEFTYIFKGLGYIYEYSGEILSKYGG